MIAAAIHGFILAFPLIMPLGVQNVFVFNQGAAHRRFTGVLPVVITACLCDTLLISLAVTGVSFLVFGSYWIKTIFMGVGIVFLIYMGWITWRTKPAPALETAVTAGSAGAAASAAAMEGKAAETVSARRQVLFALSVSLLNPHAIMDTVGVIGTSALKYAGSAKLAFTLATVTVSWFWFFGLAYAGRVTGKLDSSGRFVTLLNKVSAIIMWGVAVYLVTSLRK